MTTHMPLRPTWNCIDCAGPWPCPDYKAFRMSIGRLDEMTREQAAYLDPMIDDLVQPGDVAMAQVLHERVIAWTRADVKVGPPPGFTRTM